MEPAAPAGTERVPSLDLRRRTELAARAESLLVRHGVEPWFPRCVDARGGFFCDFDRRWTLNGPQHRMLEFQARQTRAAARLALHFPSEPRFVDYALHGFHYLRDVMWDRDLGGWYWMVDAHGAPMAAGTKHAHSISYAVQACAMVFEVAADTTALELAEYGFDWFDKRAHDDARGGYWSWMHRDGTVIRGLADLPHGLRASDPVSHEIGVRDVNVHGDWLEALTDVVRIHPGTASVSRLDELATIMLQHFTTSHGEVRFAFHPDWIPLMQPERFGYGFQAVNRLFKVPRNARAAHLRANQLLQRLVQVAPHPSGKGYMYAAAAGTPGELEGQSTRITRRIWWVQLEGARALCLAATQHAAGAGFASLFREQLDFLEGEMVDERYGGFYPMARSDLPRIRRLPGFSNATHWHKGNVWKDASHEVDSLTEIVHLLRSAT